MRFPQSRIACPYRAHDGTRSHTGSRRANISVGFRRRRHEYFVCAFSWMHPPIPASRIERFILSAVAAITMALASLPHRNLSMVALAIAHHRATCSRVRGPKSRRSRFARCRSSTIAPTKARAVHASRLKNRSPCEKTGRDSSGNTLSAAACHRRRQTLPLMPSATRSRTPFRASTAT